MSKDHKSNEDLKRRLELCANDDLLSEVKTRIDLMCEPACKIDPCIGVIGVQK